MQHMPEGSHNSVWAVWLPHELRLDRQLIYSNSAVPRGYYDLDRRPSLSDGGCQCQTSHSPGHVDIGEYQADLRMPDEHSNCGSGVFCFDNLEALVREVVRDSHAKKRLVFDDQNYKL